MRILFVLLCLLCLAKLPCASQPVIGVAYQDDAALMNPEDTSSTSIAIRYVLITGNKRTRQYIVEREIAVKEGECYTPGHLARKLRLTREQLMNTSLFVKVNVDTIDLGGNEIDIRVDVKERWYIFPGPVFRIVDRNLNVWFTDQKASIDRANIGFKVSHDNMSGRNDKFNLFLIGGYTQQLSFNYRLPYFDKKLRQGFSTAFSFSRNREVQTSTDSNKQVFTSLPEFALQNLRAEIGYSYRRGSDLRMGSSLSYSDLRIDTAIARANPQWLGNGRSQARFVDWSVYLHYYKADYNPYPLRGWYLRLNAINRFSSSIPRFQIYGDAQGSWEVLHKTWLNFQGAFAINVSRSMPYYNSRMLGYGSLYMQGLEYYVADGNYGGMVRSTVRREIWSPQIPTPFRKSKTYNKLPFRVFLKSYVNAGYVHSDNPGNSFLNNKLLRTAGFGIDILTIYDVVLKLEYSYNQLGQKGLFMHSVSDF